MYNAIFLFYGALAILSQLVIFRELAVLFYGNELFLGTFLSSWLFWTGLGSLSARRFLKDRGRVSSYLSYAFLALSFMLPTMILLVRASRSMFPLGEFIGPVPTVLYTFMAMGAVCFVMGGQFSLACALAPLGRVYMYETLGALAAGTLFTYALIGFVPTFAVALVLALFCIIASLVLSPRKRFFAKTLFYAAAFALLCLFPMVEPYANTIEWKGYRFVGQKEARNETLALADMGSIKNVFIDGMISASFPDPEAYEPIAHWPMLASISPGHVLIIGETSLGAVGEALKYRPKRVDYVIPDSYFLDAVRPYLDSAGIGALNDPAVSVHCSDPRVFVKRCRNKYDVVMINMPEVPNLKANRFFTREFYDSVNSILKPGGILALSAASSENYLSQRTRVFDASVFRTLESVFDKIEAIPGDTIIFLAGRSAIDIDEKTLLGRMVARGILNHNMIPSYIRHKLEPGRRTALKRALENAPNVRVNRDLEPTACYYFAGLWLNKFSSPLGYLAIVALAAIAVFTVFGVKASRVSGLRKERALIFSLGFTGMLMELVLMLGYQMISGCVYYQMGALFAAFMLGLFLGSLLGNLIGHGSRPKLFVYLVTLSVMMAGASVCAARLLPRLASLTTAQNIAVFTLFLADIGAAIGAAFVIAGFLAKCGDAVESAGSLYAADLWGAAAGAMLSTNLIVPAFGVTGSLYFSAASGLAGLALFLVLAGRDGV